MNHLRDLLEHIGCGQIRDLRSSAMAAEMLAYGERATSFWVGDMTGAKDLQVVDELCRMPFATCWFEGEFPRDGRSSIFLGLLADQSDEQFRGYCLMRHRSNWKLLGVIEPDSLQSPDIPIYTNGDDDFNLACLVVIFMRHFLTALHCCNVVREHHHPDARINRARASRGKKPLFSYWTLRLNGRGAAGPALGGSHASPRVHLRRGHPRQYAPGLWTWVQPCLVGRKENGVVHKDYSASSQLLEGCGQSKATI